MYGRATRAASNNNVYNQITARSIDRYIRYRETETEIDLPRKMAIGAATATTIADMAD